MFCYSTVFNILQREVIQLSTTEEGIVIRVNQTHAWVKTIRSEACKGCASRESCKPGDKGQEMEVKALNTANAKKGDLVVVGFSTSSFIKVTFLVYIFPIIALLTGAILGQSIAANMHWDESLTSVICGFAFMVLSIMIVRIISDRLAKDKRYIPVVERVKRQLTPIDNDLSQMNAL